MTNLPGYNDFGWVKQLFKIAGERKAFGDCGFEVLEPLITPNIVTYFCLADDIMVTTYYEFIAYKYLHYLKQKDCLTKDERWQQKRLQLIVKKVHRAKQKYLEVAFFGVKVPYPFKARLEPEVILSGGSPEIEYTLKVAPIILSQFRRFSSDFLSIRHIEKKYQHSFAYIIEYLRQRDDEVEKVMKVVEMIGKRTQQNVG